MSGTRVTGGTLIDRSRQLSFTFDGLRINGFEGDTIASALLASGERIVARSFKYHRPRGIWGAGVEEPNAFVDLLAGGRFAPNTRMTTEPASHGMVLRSVNTSPSARDDRWGRLDRLASFIPAAFYYKTFIWPDWHWFEWRIRGMAGLGRIDPQWRTAMQADQINAHCDILVIGGGPAGLAAALAASEAGRSVMLVDDGFRVGGSLLHRCATIDGLPGETWALETAERLRRSGCRILSRTTAYGVYDHNLVCLSQFQDDRRPDTLWRVRAGRIVVAAGAIERPIPFANNDLPGIMSAEAALGYLRRYGVRCGSRIAVYTTNDSALEPARALAEAGAEVMVIDRRAGANASGTPGLNVIAGRAVTEASGRGAVSEIALDDGSKVTVDTVLVSGGWTPTVHLFCQAGGKLGWHEGGHCLVPTSGPAGFSVAGAAAGLFELVEVLESGWAAGEPTSVPAPRAVTSTESLLSAPNWPVPSAKSRVWIDFQNDVTTKDVELAARENFVSVEHLKRYTTLGMATDQGKTSNLNGLALLAQLTGRSIEQVGTTTYRPPYVPIPLATLAGSRRGTQFAPVRRLPLEDCHRAEGAVLQEYGGWLRPAYYGDQGVADEWIQAEARAARESVALFDGSPLGKIEVIGPSAAAFLDFIYYGSVSSMRPGRLRYGFMLSESGVIYDDGVLARLDENRFIVSCSSSHVAGVYARLEEWRQDRGLQSQVFVNDATAAQATVTISGPESRALIASLDLGLPLDEPAFPHMHLAEGDFGGDPVRIARVSFTGDRSYEISIRSDRAEALWQATSHAARSLGGTMIGLEALMILRAEKGYIVIGKDTDGMTMPHDLGLGGPREKRGDDYVGRRSLFTEAACRPDRKQLVGLVVGKGEPPLETGAHGVERSNGGVRSLGYVTSSYFSPTLDRAIALGLIENGRARLGQTIKVQHLGQVRSAVVAEPCAFDPAGERLNA
jgi:sarcosine oxidase subunit alpha